MKRSILLLIAVLCVYSTSHAALVGQWQLNDPVGSESKGYVTATVGDNAGLWLQPGYGGFTGTELNFTAPATSYVDIAYEPEYRTNADFTWAAWIKTTSVTGTIISKTAGWVAGAKSLGVHGDGKLAFYAYGIPGPKSTMALNDGQWHHVAVTYDERGLGAVRLYVDGVMNVAQGMNLKSLPDLASSVKVGRGDASGWLANASIKDVRIYNHTLSDTEVANIVPEPTTMALLAIGGMFYARKRS